MLGASKINELTDDLHRLNEMFEMGLNNSQIARIYRTNSGHQISRIHVSSIRRNKRWNSDKRSFLMKHELGGSFSVSTKIGQTQYKTVVGVVFTDESNLYTYLTYKDSVLQNGNMSYLMTKQPSTEELMKFHNQWIYDDISHI
jgi:hypothetical protein